MIPFMILRHYLFSLLVIVISVMVLVWLYSTNELTLQLPKLDSIGHFLGFFFLTWLLSALLKQPLFNLAMCLTFYAALTEVGQHYLGFRNGEFRDFVADILGIALFVTVKYVWIKFSENKQ